MRLERLESTDAFKNWQDLLVADYDREFRRIIISAGTCGQASGANELIRITKRELLKKKLVDRIEIRITGCHGFCEMEPSILVEPERTFYPKVKPKDMVRIVEAVARGEVLEDLLYVDHNSGKKIKKQDDLPFFRIQKRTILARNEKIDPIRIFNYIENGGYSALAKALKKNDPRWIVEEVKKSGLRGRGGAGFPTGKKWEFLANRFNGAEKYIVCNADEGDPGAYMDRCVLEGNPHSIIEGMIIGAYGTGATKGVIYVRNEYPLAIKHLIIALRQAREIGVLGENILGTGFSFDISLVRGAGAFVCGEETALMRSIEGKIGEPRQRPPFPVEKGIHNKPTLINNVETWANIPVIIMDGAEEFAKIGTKDNSGTKIFSLVGKIKNTGLVEVPMGIRIKSVIDDIGGGPSGKVPIKAVQTGGPSGGCIPVRRFDLAIDYDTLSQAGSIMGSGGMIAMDENTCMVDVAKYFMQFLKDESCGKCFTCRKGTQRMYEILDDISVGKGTPQHLELLEELALVVKDTTMCGLGQTAPNPVLSTLRYFREEFMEHIQNKRCPAGVCKALISYSINHNCTGCQACLRVCPENAISGEKKQLHVIDQEKCIKCGACMSVCKFEAVKVK
jgi:NADH:ubiquinone oxidoreductase subunit F (NADH-binding)/(2Fe-2S) ferredoxin/NAD-dependent dihydropyrimidine dehydrogenase PreA subunit